jgi:hypothetical protein
MQKRKTLMGIPLFLILACFLFSETTLIKNANVYLPNGDYQPDSFIVIEGAKISAIGLMKDLKEKIPDREFDVEGGFVYPAFIDSYYTGFLKTAAKKKEESSRGAGSPSVDKTSRKSLLERNYFITSKSIDALKLDASKAKKLISQGFAFLHIVPKNGIISGTTGVVSLVSDKTQETVLVPEKFLALFYKTNSTAYPSTQASVLAEIFQLKEDVSHYQKMKKAHYFHRSKRIPYQPELDILLPYFKNKRQFLITVGNLVQHRMTDLLTAELRVNPVLVASSDIWRRPVNSQVEVIMPLKFKPPMGSRYAQMGDKYKKDVEKNLYPKKIAEFFKTHRRISLTAPDTGDYKTLFKNIRTLIKYGVTETDIIRSLTETPAKLLDISRYSGTLQVGKLASFFVSNKKIFEEKVEIKKAFVEGKFFDFKQKKGKVKPPAKNLTGKWLVKIESQMGNFELTMTIEQEGNDFTAELVSAMGKIEVQNGVVSGDEVTFSASAPIGGQDTSMEFSGKIKGDKIEGTISIGSFGDANLVATPENRQGGLK